MSYILIENAHLAMTMDDAAREIPSADILLHGGAIVAIGQKLGATLSPEIAANLTRHDATGCLVTPGLVNTHHHLYQTLTRAVPAAQDALLFGWLQTLYPIWARFGPEEMHSASVIGLAELALSGCSLSSDHMYIFPNGARLEDSIDAAAQVGLRFHPTRGAMSIGQSKGGLPPDSLVESEATILEDMIRVIDTHHDGREGAMLRVGVAPCSPFSVSRELMRDSALLARDKGVMMHTHLAENQEDVAYSREKFGCTPGEFARDLGWVGEDVWHAHCVKLESRDLEMFAATRTGVAHCPCSNCRLGSGIAPIREMLDAGVPLGLGVDGSASNDMGNMMSEARQMMLLQRVKNGADAMSARSALRVATRGGAEVLGRHDCGQLAVGKRADIAIWDLGGLEAAGNWDPAAILLAGTHRVRDLYVEGRAVVQGGHLATVDLARAIEQQNRLAINLM
jgi:cytosine/adenosine deaminase-related metal-dependent hydrolase